MKKKRRNKTNKKKVVHKKLVTQSTYKSNVYKAISILKIKPKIKRTMWSRRAQEYEQKINSGKLYQLAEVVKDLNKKTDVVAEQSYSERQLFEKAYERLKSEFEVILGEKAKIKMDKALKRNENLVQTPE